MSDHFWRDVGIVVAMFVCGYVLIVYGAFHDKQLCQESQAVDEIVRRGLSAKFLPKGYELPDAKANCPECIGHAAKTSAGNKSIAIGTGVQPEVHDPNVLQIIDISRPLQATQMEVHCLDTNKVVFFENHGAGGWCQK